MENFVALMVLVSSVFLKCVGMPDQVRKLYKSKNSKGFSLVYYIALEITYLLWIAHGSYKKDWVVISTSILGATATGVIVFLIIKYRPKQGEVIKKN